MGDAPERAESLAFHLREMSDKAIDQIDSDRLARAADIVDATDAQVAALVEDRQRLIYVLEGVHAAIRTGRNEPLEIWREQIEIALEAVRARAALRDLEAP